MVNKLFFSLLFLMFFNFVFALSDDYIIHWINERPIIDGVLDDTIWQNIPKYKFLEAMTGKQTDVITLISFCIDNENLYFAFDVYDTSIFATYSKRDEPLYEQDVVELFICLCDNTETQSYIEIEVSPNNIIFDAFILHNKNINFEEAKKWNADEIKSAVNKTDYGYQVEIQLPLKYINFDEKRDKSILLNATRIDRDDEKSEYKYFALSPTFGWFHKPECFKQFIIKK